MKLIPLAVTMAAAFALTARGETMPEPQPKIDVHPSLSGRIEQVIYGDEFWDISSDLWVAEPNWKEIHAHWEASKITCDTLDDGSERWRGELPAGGKKKVDFERIISREEGAVHVQLKATARQAVDLEGVFLVMRFPVNDFAEGTCLISTTNDREPSISTTCPAELPEDFRFANGRGDRLTMTSADGKYQASLRFDKSRWLNVQDNREYASDNYSLIVGFGAQSLEKGESTSLDYTLTFKRPLDHRRATVRVDFSKKLYQFDGFGGNFCYGQGSVTARHSLNNIRMGWARVGMNLREWEPKNDNDSPGKTDYAKLAQNDRAGTNLRAGFEVMQKLTKLGVPYVASVWYVPDFASEPVPGSDRQRVIPEEKWPELLECIGSYLLYAKEHYGTEPALFSFNESDIGVNVLLDAAEHRDQIKRMGEYFKKIGLKTRMLLGDVARRENTAFCTPTIDDPEAMQYVGAVAFHSWGQRAGNFGPWRELAQKTHLPLLVTEVGPDAEAWKGHTWTTLYYFSRELRMYQELLQAAHPQTLLEWEYTDDYDMFDVDYQKDGQPRRTPSARYWMITQFANSTPRPAWAAAAESDHPKVLVTAFAGTDEATGKKRFVIHIANIGAARGATLVGVPITAKTLEATQMSWSSKPKKITPSQEEAGVWEMNLESFSLTTFAFEE